MGRGLLKQNALIFLGLITPALALAGQQITIQGRVSTSAGTPVNGPATQFRVQILTPDANECVLYDETQVIDLSTSNGLFSINLNNGSGTVNAPATYTLEQALSNRAGFSVSSSYCASGSGTIAYSPSSFDNRKVVIRFRDPATMSSFEVIPAMSLNPTPYSIESRTLGGFPAASVLRVQDAGITGTTTPLSTAQYTELQNLVGGTSNNYMSSTAGSTTGARLPSVAGNPSAPAAGSIWFDTSGSGSIKFRDSAGTVQTLGLATAGAISSITAGTGLTGGGSSGAVSLALSPSGVSGAGVAIGSTSTVPVITYDTYGRITSATTAAISGTLPSGTAGQFLKSSGGSTWAGAGILMGDLKNSLGSLPLFGTVNCSASQSMYWDSGADQIRCQNISVGNSQISDVDWSKLTGVPNLVANAGGTPSLLTDTEANLPTVHVNGRIFIASDTKKIFRDNGTTWDELAPGSGGTLTNVVSGAGISVSGTGATRTVALDNAGKAAGTFYKVTTDADGRVSSGAGALVAADIPNLDWGKITTGKPDFVLNALDTKSFTTGPTSAQPTGQTAGRVFINTTLQKIQYDNGTTWIDVASNGGTGFSGSLNGEVRGTQSATTVHDIGGIVNADIVTHLTSVSNATDAATATRLVKRDASGDFAGRKISATEMIVKGSAHTASLTADPSADYSLKLPDTKATVNGQLLSSDTNGVLSWASPSSSFGSIAVNPPVTNTSGTIGMPSANTSRDGYLSSTDWNTFSGKLSATLNSALIWVGNGSNVATPVAPSGDVTMTNSGAFAVNKIKGTNISAVPSTAGQVLRYDGTDYTPAFTRMADLRSTVTGTSAITGNCTAAQTLTWNSGTDSLQCQNISIAASTQITGVLPIANGGTGTNSAGQNLVFAGPASGGAGAPAFRALTSADLPAAANLWATDGTDIWRASGKVGIGTTSPSVGMHLKATNYNNTTHPFNFNLEDAGPSAVGAGGGFVFSGNDGVFTDRWFAGVHGGKENAASGDYAGFVALHTRSNGAGSITERMRIDSNGYVGIGTTVPGHKLEVAGNIGLSASGYVNFGTNDGSSGYGIRDNAGILEYKNSSGSWAVLGGTASQWATGSGNISYTGGSVGIGTTAPTASLHVVGGIRVSQAIQASTITTNQLLLANNQVDASGALLSAGDSLNFIADNNNDGTGAFNFRKGNTNPASATPLMTITNAGSVGIGTSVPASALDVLGGSTSRGASAGFVAYDRSGSTTKFAGLYRTSDKTYLADEIANRVTIDNTNGNVGIGISTPGAKLEVDSGTANTSGVKITRLTSSTPTSTGQAIGVDASGNIVTVASSGGGSSQWADGGSSKIYYSAGNVGIGTNNPGMTLEVVGNVKSSHLYTGNIYANTTTLNNGSQTGNSYSFAYYPGTGMYMPANGQLGLSSNNLERIRIDASGNVGIGSATPGQKLTVAGTVESTTGGFKFPDGTVQTSAATGGTSANATINSQRVGATGSVSCPAGYSVTGCWAYTPSGTDVSGTTISGSTCSGNSGAYFVEAVCTQISGVVTGGWTQSGSVVSYSAGNVGIGSASPGQKLTVAGTIESTSGGVKFPDGTVQTSASPTATSATVNMASTFTISSAGFMDTGFSITLPSAGTYMVMGDIRGGVQGTASNNWINVKLVNATDSADVGGSATIITYTDGVNQGIQSTGSIHVVITANGSKVIKLYANRNCGGTCSASIMSDGNGLTRLSYIKVSN